jgi:hypothetical protein
MAWERFKELNSAADAQAEAEEIQQVWCNESILIIRLLIYCARLLERIASK